jgi:hypothetical protein
LSWWVTKTEVYKDGHRELYHRNGGTRPGWEQKVSRTWTHPDTDEAKAACEVCSKPEVTAVDRRARREKRRSKAREALEVILADKKL